MNKKGIQGRFLKDEALMLKILKAVVSTFDWEEAVTARKRKEKKKKQKKASVRVHMQHIHHRVTNE